MLFPSLAFIYIFLPVFLILYFINRSSLYRNLLLLIGSLVFYAWGEPVFVLMLMAMILVNWGAALWIEKHKQASQPHGTLIAAGAIALNLLPLVFLKVITTSQWDGAWLQSLRAACPKLSFPLGISFFTFSAIAYIVDVNDYATYFL
jgi:alginate O-acetyltransferase complex protein AlgI